MPLNAANATGGSSPRPPALDPENYLARLVQIMDLGIQKQRPYQGTEKAPIQEIMLTYELVTEFMPGEDGEPDTDRPRWVSERIPLYNLKAEKAKSTLRYLALDPAQKFKGDFSKLLGKPCLVAIVNNERNGVTYNNIGSVSPPIKGMTVAALVNEPSILDLSNPDVEVFHSLPEWIQKVIKEGLDYPKSGLASALRDGPVVKATVDTEEEEDEGDSFPL